MVQREVADRFFAVPRTKAYGAVSVLLQLQRAARRLPSRAADRVSPETTRRVGARRFRAHRRCASSRARASRRRGVVRSSKEDARQLRRSRRTCDARRRRACARGHRKVGRQPCGRARTGRVRRAGEVAHVSSGRACAKINLGTRRGAASGRWEARGRHGSRANRPVRHDRGRDHPLGRDRRRGLRGHHRAARARGAHAARRRVRAGGRSRSRSASRSPRVSEVAAADAGTALRLANELLDTPLSGHQLHDVAADIGADVPFFLEAGSQLATGDGTELAPISIPLDFWVVLVMPSGIAEDVDRRRLSSVRRSSAKCGVRGASHGADACAPWRPSHLGPRSTAAQRPGDIARDRRSRDDSARCMRMSRAPARRSTGSSRIEVRAERASRELEGRGQRWVVRPAPVS